MLIESSAIRKIRLLIVPLIVSILCTILAIVLTTASIFIWENFPHPIGNVTNIVLVLEGVIILMLSLVTTCAISVALLNDIDSNVGSRPGIIGFISGFSMATILFEPELILFLGGHIKPIFFYSPVVFIQGIIYSIPFFIRSPQLLQLSVILMVILIYIFSIGFAIAITSRLLTYAQEKKREGHDGYLLRTIVGPVILMIIASLLIPMIVMAGIMLGVLPHPTSISYSALASGEGKGFIYNGGPGAKYLDNQMPFIIHINGILATNQSVARNNGLNITMKPESGLGYTEGSRVIIGGLNRSAKIDLTANFKDGIQVYLGSII